MGTFSDREERSPTLPAISLRGSARVGTRADWHVRYEYPLWRTDDWAKTPGSLGTKARRLPIPASLPDSEV
jgi:hypothetical protein